MKDIVAISLSDRQIMFSDGSTLAITDFYDGTGSHCAPEEALSCVAGPDAEGFWWTLSVCDFGGTIH